MTALVLSAASSSRSRACALGMLPDERLVRRAALGDRGAFAVIFERHHQAVFRYCRSILRNEEDAADALQNTMAAALRGLDGETREIALKAWLFRIAHNESLSLIRRRRDDRAFDDDLSVEAPGGPEFEALQSERLRQLVDDVQALPERQRGALVMRELSGLQYAEIAGALECAEGTARQAVHEAREMLHDLGEGRAMPCLDVRALISAGDGRRLRGRKVRAHLRACPDCEVFRDAIGSRRAALAAVAPPLPVALGALMLQRLLGPSGHGGGLAAGGASATTASVTAGSTTAGNGLAGVGVLANGAATAAMATKAAVTFAAGAVLAGGGLGAEQRVSADRDRAAPAPGAVAAREVPTARRPVAASAPLRHVGRQTGPALRGDALREEAERGADPPVAGATGLSAASPRTSSAERIADLPTAPSRPVTAAPTARPGAAVDSRSDRPAGGQPATSTSAVVPAQRPLAPPPAPAQKPLVAETTDQGGASPSTATVPSGAGSPPAAPIAPEQPARALPKVPVDRP